MIVVIIKIFDLKPIQDHYYHALYLIHVVMHVMVCVVLIVLVGQLYVVIVVVSLIVKSMIIIVHVSVYLIFGALIYFGLDANEVLDNIEIEKIFSYFCTAII